MLLSAGELRPRLSLGGNTFVFEQYSKTATLTNSNLEDGKRSRNLKRLSKLKSFWENLPGFLDESDGVIDSRSNNSSRQNSADHNFASPPPFLDGPSVALGFRDDPLLMSSEQVASLWTLAFTDALSPEMAGR
jgi:hypothetical protein